MDIDSSFMDLMARVRGGEEQAACDLLHLYEPYVRRVVRVKLTDPALRRQMDSMDVCQSVLGDFFVRVALGQFDINTPNDLIALLAEMVRNKVKYHARKQKAAKRDIRRLEKVEIGEMQVAGTDPTPSRIVAGASCWTGFATGSTRRNATWWSNGTWNDRGWKLLPSCIPSPMHCACGWRGSLDRVTRELGIEGQNDAGV